MCDHPETDNPFPSVTIGGPPGDYLLPPPVTSNQFIEYQVISVACSGTNPGVVQVSGVTKPQTLDTSGNSTYNGENNNASIRSHVITVAPNSYIPVDGPWEQVSSPNMHVFIRIDGATAAFVTIKQRAKLLLKVPQPFVTVPRDEPEAMNVAREERILQSVLGSEGRELEYARKPARKGTVRELTTGSTEISGWAKRGPTRRGG